MQKKWLSTWIMTFICAFVSFTLISNADPLEEANYKYLRAPVINGTSAEEGVPFTLVSDADGIRGVVENGWRPFLAFVRISVPSVMSRGENGIEGASDTVVLFKGERKLNHLDIGESADGDWVLLEKTWDEDSHTIYTFGYRWFLGKNGVYGTSSAYDSIRMNEDTPASATGMKVWMFGVNCDSLRGYSDHLSDCGLGLFSEALKEEKSGKEENCSAPYEIF